MPLSWTEGCTPRITVHGCDECLRDLVIGTKVVTFASQVLTAGSALRFLARCSEARKGVGLSQMVILAYSTLGAIHSICLVAAFPADQGSEASLLAVELLYSTYNALLIGGLIFLGRIWLEKYHSEVFVDTDPKSGSTAGSARAWCWGCLALALLAALASDAFLLASPTAGTFEAVEKAQHSIFLLLCAVCVAASVWRLQLLQGTGPFSAWSASPASVAYGRMRAAQFLITSLWVICLTFCTTCILLSMAHSSRNPTNPFFVLSWTLHASFPFAGGGAIAVLTFVLLHRPCWLDRFRCFYVKPPNVETSQPRDSKDKEISPAATGGARAAGA